MLIKVRKVVSLLSGLDDRSGNSGGMFQHTKQVLVITSRFTVAKNDPCADVSGKYKKIYQMDEMPDESKKSLTNDFKPAARLLMSRLIYCRQMTAIHQATQFIRH